MDRYTARINARGSSYSERRMNQAIQNINNKIEGNPSYKLTTKLNGEPVNLVIDDGTSHVYKKVTGLPGQILRLGDYVDWDNKKYLITSLDPDDEMYITGTMTICMFRLCWQRPDGKIITRWATVSDASKYEAGVTSNGVLSVGSNTNGLVLPLDNETKFLKRDHRFVMDKITGEEFEKMHIPPDTYVLTNDKPILNDYSYFNRGATTTILLGFSAFNPQTDKWVQLSDGTYSWICNYFNPQNPKPDPVFNYKAQIIGGSTIKTHKRTWEVEFTDDDGNIVDFHDFIWKVDCGEYDDFIEMIYDYTNDCSIGLKCKNGKDDIGKEYDLLVTKVYGEVLTSIHIEVVGI